MNPGVNAKGSFSSRIRAGSRAAAANVARALAAVPPDMLPFTLRRRALTRRAGRPNFSRAFSCNVSTPRSNGMESKPQEKTMRAPVRFASS